MSDDTRPDPISALDEQRAPFYAARRVAADALVARRDAERRVELLARQSTQVTDRELRTARDAASAAADAASEARKRAAAARDRLHEGLRAHVDVSPEGEVARLAGDRPLVLLPVRIETRFQDESLLVRVYPDDVFADTHEPELTDTEIADGTRFWSDGWPSEDAERRAWKVLVDAVGAPRAAWIAHVMTPTNLAARPQGAPVLPAPARRTSAWSRAAEARLLPDRWILAFYRNNALQHQITGPAIGEPLILTFGPDTPEGERSPLSDDGLNIDDAARWTMDFAAAERVGMGVRLALTADDRRDGFDRVIVLGVKSSLAPDNVPAALAALFDQHRYGRGVAIVQQGTPTNHTVAAPSGGRGPDPEGRASFDAERVPRTLDAEHDGARLMRALGLPTATAASWAGATGTADRSAQAMARALWPVTLGYWLEQMMAPVFDDTAIGATRRFFVEHVRGRGPLPAFRIGNTPYGALPVTSLANWTPPKRAPAFDQTLPDGLRRARGVWMDHVAQVPRVGATTDPDADLLAILGMDASTREVRIRSVLGEDTMWNVFGVIAAGGAWPVWIDAGQAMASAAFARIGHPEWVPRVARFNFGAAYPFRFALVADAPLSEHDGLVPNYVDWIAKARVPALETESWPDGAKPTALLYRLLRHAALLEYHDAAFSLLLKYAEVTLAERREDELVRVTATQRPTRMERLRLPLAAVSGTEPLHVFLETPANRPLIETLLPGGVVIGLRDAMRTLAPLPTAELDRLTSETLDVVSHRIDAWITALASRRLDAMREAQPNGCHLGAYGWVEDLRPKHEEIAPRMALSRGRSAALQRDNGGFIQAPTMTHAAAAAVLRSAHLSRRGSDPSRYAVNLSSARVRTARFVLDAVREGQPLGAVLGYQVERGLHDRRQDIVIAPLRAKYPLVAKKANDPADTDEPTEQIAARNVVDGLALRRAWQANAVPWGQDGLPSAGTARTALETELAALDATADAVADLLTAESVYQLVRGTTGGAAATLDAMAQGSVRPPDPEIAIQPRRGTPLTHRIAVVLGSVAAALPAGWPGVPTPRAAAEPALDAWLGSMFGNPTAVTCSVELGPPTAPVGTTAVTLAQLGLRPIDVLALTRGQTERNAGASRSAASEIDRRIAIAAHTALGIMVETEVRITYALPAGGDRTITRGFGDVLALARTVLEVLAKARPLRAPDLVAEDRGAAADAADRLPGETLARADAAVVAMDTMRLTGLDPAIAAAKAAAPSAAFDLTALRDALLEAAGFGISNAIPLSAAGSSTEQRAALVVQAESVRAELAHRASQAKAMLTDARLPLHAADAGYQVDAAQRAVAALLGADAPFLPAFRPAESAELANAIAHHASGVFIDANPIARARAVLRFEAVAARIRPAVDGWRRLGLACHALGIAAPPHVVAQLPADTTARWVGLPFADEAHRPGSGKISVLLHQVTTPAVGDRWSGLLLDEWTEFIPSPIEQTGVAFHYDDPGAEAPQAVLVAVPPVEAERWTFDWVLSTLNETLDLAKIRAVDNELLGEFGQVLPAIYLADATDEVTVQTRFADALRLEATIFRISEE